MLRAGCHINRLNLVFISHPRRQLSSVGVARAKGRVGGRRPKFTDEQWKEMGKMLAVGASRQNVSEIYEVGISTLYKKFPVNH